MGRPFAIVTAASWGIGFDLAAVCAHAGFDLLIASDRPEIQQAAIVLRAAGVDVTGLEVDLGTTDGVDRLWRAVDDRPVDALVANVGCNGGQTFLDQDFRDLSRAIEANIMGTAYLVQLAGRQMQRRGAGRILLTGAMTGLTGANLHPLSGATTAFIDSFAAALRAELQDSGVTVTYVTQAAQAREVL